DIEGSTKLLHELGGEGYAEALAQHRRVVRQACTRAWLTRGTRVWLPRFDPLSPLAGGSGYDRSGQSRQLCMLETMPPRASRSRSVRCSPSSRSGPDELWPLPSPCGMSGPGRFVKSE